MNRGRYRYPLGAALSVFILMAGAALLSGCAGSSPQRTGSTRPTATAADADRLAAFALRTWAADRNADQALVLIRQATGVAPNRPDLAWLHLRLCAERTGCEPEALESQLRKLDRDNGIVWLSVLGRAQARRDTAAEQQILEAMSRAPRFDLYWTTTMARLTPNVVVPTIALPPNPSSNVPPPPNIPLTNALNDMAGWLSRISTPAFQPLGTACSAMQAKDAPAQARCLRIAQALQQSDSSLAEGVGLGIAQRFTAPGSAAAASIDKRIATLSYQSQTAGAVMQGQIEHEKFSAQVLELMKKLHREQDVSVAILRWAGQPVTL